MNIPKIELISSKDNTNILDNVENPIDTYIGRKRDKFCHGSIWLAYNHTPTGLVNIK